MVRLAEKILRKHPEHITILAPVIAYIFTFMCGTGPSFTACCQSSMSRHGYGHPAGAPHLGYRRRIPECHHRLPHLCGYGRHPRSGWPTTATSICSICCWSGMPATLLGSVAAGISVLHRGKELSEDPEYLERIKQGPCQGLQAE